MPGLPTGAAPPRLGKMRLDHRCRHLRHIRPVPARLVVLVQQAGAHAFAEFRVAATVQAHAVFHLEHLRQRQVPRPADLLPHQVCRQRAAFVQALAGSCQQGVVMLLEPFQRTPGRGRIGHVEQLIDLLPSRQPLGLWQLGASSMLLGLEQAVQLHGSLFLPVKLQ